MEKKITQSIEEIEARIRELFPKHVSKNREGNRKPIPQEIKDLVAEINENERILGETYGNPHLFDRNEALKKSLPSEYRLIPEWKHGNIYRVEYA
jgi:hypothetical protein